MTIADGALLGLVQGITEFLPISSDGHLVLLDVWLGVTLSPRDALGFDLLLHGGSLLALLVCTGKRWFRMLLDAARGDVRTRKILLWIVLATIPGGIAGLLLEDVVTTQRTVPAAAGGFVVTALALVIGDLLGRQSSRAGLDVSHVGWWRALLVGCAQAFAILPGVSRSGLTISTGIGSGLSRQQAFEFSFLMAVPIIGAAVAKGALDLALGAVQLPLGPVAAAGFLTSFVVSIAAYLALRAIVARISLAWFALYLLPVACALLYTSMGGPHIFEHEHLLLLVRRYGAIVVFLFALLESTPPFSFFAPGIVVLLIAGSLAPTPFMLLIFMLAAAIGVWLPGTVFYLLGVGYGRSIAHRFHLREKHLDAADRYFAKFGAASVIVGQFVGMVRPAIGFVAGTARMRRRLYFPCLFVSGLVWSVFYLLVGFVLQGSVRWLAAVVSIGGLLISIIIVCVAGLAGARAVVRPSK